MIEAMKQALEKIANVNAMDYEYQRWAREALAIAGLESQEPVAWMHIMDNTEGIKANGAGIVSITQKRKHPFGKPGIDFSKSYPVTSTPLYTHPPQRTEQEGKQMIDWYSVEGETRSYGVGMVECAYAIGRDEVVHVVTHESVKDIAMQHLPIQRTWVGLTKEQLATTDWSADFRAGALWAEAKLKERNT